MLDAKANDFQRPEFTLSIDTTGVGAEVRLNDIPVDFDMYGGHSTSSYDVNESIIGGINELEVIVFPFFVDTDDDAKQTTEYHDEAEIKVTLRVKEKGIKNTEQVLSQIHLIPSAKIKSQDFNKSIYIEKLDNVVISETLHAISFPGYKFKKQIVATRKSLPVQENYPRWKWQDGKDIENSKETYDSLLMYYRKIYESLARKDMQKLFELYEPAAKEFAVAYRLDEGVKEGHRFIETGEILNNSNAELYDFFTDGVKLDIFGNGKLARIVDIGLYHPVVFVHKTEDIVYTQKFSFYKNQKDEWVMIR